LLTSLLFGRLALMPQDAAVTLMDLKTLSLMLMVYLVFFLNNFLSSTGAMKKLIDSLESIITEPKVVISLIPALIGLIPSPSGAVLSAPFTDEIGGRTNMPKERKLLVNYWFRHISEYVNPIYPGVLVATTLLGISFYTFFVSNMPVMLVYIAVGVFAFILPIKSTARAGGGKAGMWGVIQGAAPIMVAVILPVTLNLDLSISLLAAIACAIIFNAKAKKDYIQISRDSFKYDLIILVFLIMLFKTVLDQSRAAEMMSASLLSMGAPAPLLLTIIPATVGFLTGLTIGFVGLTFPILMPLLLQTNGTPNMAHITLAYVSGYLGILLSPMHLCLTVTRKYFNVEQKQTYKLLLPTLTIIFLWTLVYTLIIR
jgi:integral membrane protein (TIGR00529 family)